jgi:hypothetical protein
MTRAFNEKAKILYKDNLKFSDSDLNNVEWADILGENDGAGGSRPVYDSNKYVGFSLKTTQQQIDNINLRIVKQASAITTAYYLAKSSNNATNVSVEVEQPSSQNVMQSSQKLIQRI